MKQDVQIDVDVGIDVGIAVESANSESFSTSAANFAELPQSLKWVEESTHNPGDFSNIAEYAIIFFFSSPLFYGFLLKQCARKRKSTDFAFAAVQRCENLVDLEKC